MNLLFVCTMNRWRSPTAQRLYADHQDLAVRSRGTSPKAVQSLTSKDLTWADMICVMERKHRSKIEASYADAVRCKTIHVLDIPDDYRFMDEELLQLISQTVDPLLPRKNR